jgi:hypothetical protein
MPIVVLIIQPLVIGFIGIDAWTRTARVATHQRKGAYANFVSTPVATIRSSVPGGAERDHRGVIIC